jgi:hypothetical protein
MDRIYLSSVLIFLLLVGVSVSAVIFYPRLPARHREDETNATIRLIANVFVVMTSLVFGLMVNSARGSYQELDQNIHSFATQLILFDRTLRELNPGSNDGRARLVAYVQYVVSQPLPTEDPLVKGDRTSEGLLNAVGDVLKTVNPQGERELSLLQDARHQFEQLTQQRWAIVEHSTDSIPVPMVIMLVAWLAVIFASFGYRAPCNATVIAALVVAALLISASLAMVMDMNVPFSGLIQVSDQPLRSVLAEIRH